MTIFLSSCSSAAFKKCAIPFTEAGIGGNDIVVKKIVIVKHQNDKTVTNLLMTHR